uniref:Uncharacterized protein n=1 Tax=Cannabis sativa TaxID=3483 RepID=A0A803QX52_CANSA
MCGRWFDRIVDVIVDLCRSCFIHAEGTLIAHSIFSFNILKSLLVRKKFIKITFSRIEIYKITFCLLCIGDT